MTKKKSSSTSSSSKNYPGSPPWKLKQKVSMTRVVSTLEKEKKKKKNKEEENVDDDDKNKNTTTTTTNKEEGKQQEKELPSPRVLPFSLDLNDDDNDTTTNDNIIGSKDMVKNKNLRNDEKDNSIENNNNNNMETIDGVQEFDALFSNVSTKRLSIVEKGGGSAGTADAAAGGPLDQGGGPPLITNPLLDHHHQQQHQHHQQQHQQNDEQQQQQETELDPLEFQIASIFPPSNNNNNNDEPTSSTTYPSFHQSFSTRINIHDDDDDENENEDEKNKQNNNHNHNDTPPPHPHFPPPTNNNKTPENYQVMSQTVPQLRPDVLLGRNEGGRRGEEEGVEEEEANNTNNNHHHHRLSPTPMETNILNTTNDTGPLLNVYYTTLHDTNNNDTNRNIIETIKSKWNNYHHSSSSDGGKYYIGMIQATLFSWLYYIRPIHSIGIPLVMIWYHFPTERIAYVTVLLLIVLIIIPVQQEKSIWTVKVIGILLSPILSYFDYTEIIENSPIHIRESIIAHQKRYIFACQPHGVVPFCSIAHSIRQAQLVSATATANAASSNANGNATTTQQERKRAIQIQQNQEEELSQSTIDTSSNRGDDDDEDDDDNDSNDSDVWEPVNYTMPLYPTAVASQVLWTPILNHVMGLFQCVSASRGSLKHALQTTSVQLYVGGTLELFQTTPEEEILHLSKKKGFIKCALQWGVDIIPVYLFGNTRIYNVLQSPSILGKISQTLQFPVTYWYGYEIYGIPLPIPRGSPREKLLYVSGQPLGIPHIPNPRPAIVNMWHKKYCREVQRIFDQYKERLPHYKKKTLVIV